MSTNGEERASEPEEIYDAEIMDHGRLAASGRRTSPPFTRMLYNHNPFYLISAGCVLYGLWMAYRVEEGTPVATWLMAGSLAAYALLVALTAALIVRYGKVWEDARSLCLVLILIFFAISVSFDETLQHDPGTAAAVLLAGLCFSIVVTEGLIAVLKVKLPFCYRGPLYLLLLLLYGYPLSMGVELTELSSTRIVHGLLLFPVLAAGAFLTLIPAVRRGSRAVAKNGTPWSYPWYPWPIFVFLLTCVTIRSYLLTLSFQPAVGYETSFGLYFVVPLLLAVLVLLFEAARAARSALLQQVALAMAPLLLLAAFPWGGGSVYWSALDQLTASVGSPLWLTLVALLAFYLFALWHHGVAAARWGVVACFVGLTFVGPPTIGWDTVGELRWWPLAIVTAMLLEYAIRRPNSATWFAVANAFLALFLIAPTGVAWHEKHVVLLLLHGYLAAVLVIAYRYGDPFARFLRMISAVWLILAGMGAVGYGGAGAEGWKLAYLGGLIVCSQALYWMTRKYGWLACTATHVCLLAGVCLTTVHDRMAAAIDSRATVALALGVVCFAVGALISAAKAGMFAAPRYRQWWQQLWHAPPGQWI